MRWHITRASGTFQLVTADIVTMCLNPATFPLGIALSSLGTLSSPVLCLDANFHCHTLMDSPGQPKLGQKGRIREAG